MDSDKDSSNWCLKIDTVWSEEKSNNIVIKEEDISDIEPEVSAETTNEEESEKNGWKMISDGPFEEKNSLANSVINYEDPLNNMQHRKATRRNSNLGTVNGFSKSCQHNSKKFSLIKKKFRCSDCKAQACPECCTIVPTTVQNHMYGSDSNSQSSETYPCKDCDLFFLSYCALQAHTRLHRLDGPYVCPDCGVVYNNIYFLTLHLINKCYHVYKIVKFKCSGCFSSYMSLQDFYRHIEDAHILLLYKCSNCTKTCGDFEKLFLHQQREHKNEKAHHIIYFRCLMCADLVMPKYMYPDHIKHHRDHSVTHHFALLCPCGQPYNSTNGFRAHFQTCEKRGILPEQWSFLQARIKHPEITEVFSLKTAELLKEKAEIGKAKWSLRPCRFCGSILKLSCLDAHSICPKCEEKPDYDLTKEENYEKGESSVITESEERLLLKENQTISTESQDSGEGFNSDSPRVRIDESGTSDNLVVVEAATEIGTEEETSSRPKEDNIDAQQQTDPPLVNESQGTEKCPDKEIPEEIEDNLAEEPEKDEDSKNDEDDNHSNDSNDSNDSIDSIPSKKSDITYEHIPTDHLGYLKTSEGSLLKETLDTEDLKDVESFGDFETILDEETGMMVSVKVVNKRTPSPALPDLEEFLKPDSPEFSDLEDAAPLSKPRKSKVTSLHSSGKLKPAVGFISLNNLLNSHSSNSNCNNNNSNSSSNHNTVISLASGPGGKPKPIAPQRTFFCPFCTLEFPLHSTSFQRFRLHVECYHSDAALDITVHESMKVKTKVEDIAGDPVLDESENTKLVLRPCGPKKKLVKSNAVKESNDFLAIVKRSPSKSILSSMKESKSKESKTKEKLQAVQFDSLQSNNLTEKDLTSMPSTSAHDEGKDIDCTASIGDDKESHPSLSSTESKIIITNIGEVKEGKKKTEKQATNEISVTAKKEKESEISKAEDISNDSLQVNPPEKIALTETSLNDSNVLKSEKPIVQLSTQDTEILNSSKKRSLEDSETSDGDKPHPRSILKSSRKRTIDLRNKDDETDDSPPSQKKEREVWSELYETLKFAERLKNKKAKRARPPLNKDEKVAALANYSAKRVVKKPRRFMESSWSEESGEESSFEISNDEWEPGEAEEVRKNDDSLKQEFQNSVKPVTPEKIKLEEKEVIPEEKTISEAKIAQQTQDKVDEEVKTAVDYWCSVLEKKNIHFELVKKPDLQPSPIQTGEQISATKPEKRSRGRPRKYFKLDKVANENVKKKIGDETVVRKRGRPRKYDPQEQNTNKEVKERRLSDIDKEVSFIEKNFETEKTESGSNKRKRKLSSKLMYYKQSYTPGKKDDFASGQVISNKNSNDNKKLICAVCKESHSNTSDFRQHILIHRMDENTYQCMECGECFVVRPSLEKHLHAFHKIQDTDRYIVENNCCATSKNAEVEREPLKENQCKVCLDQFNSSADLNKHFRIHGMAFLKEVRKENKN